MLTSMSSVDAAIDTIRRVAGKLGLAEFSRLSDVPYTTLRECEQRDFRGRPIETLDKLVKAAERYERENGEILPGGASD